MKPPTRKQLAKSIRLIRAQVRDAAVRIDKLKSYGPSVIGQDAYDRLRNAHKTVDAADDQLIDLQIIQDSRS